MSSERDNVMKEDEDVAEIRKAMATGSNQQISGTVSSGQSRSSLSTEQSSF